MMDDLVVQLSRWQCAATALYHFLFVPLTLKLSFLLAAMKTHWELACPPRIPSPAAYFRFVRALKNAAREHPEWKGPVVRQAMRTLPSRNGIRVK
jgi:hypothetical protein